MGARLLFVVWVVMVICSCATTNYAVLPQPVDIQIISPETDIPLELRIFSGKWSGRWWMLSCPSSHGLDAVLTIERIEKTQEAIRAAVTYCWGNSPEWNTSMGCERFDASFSRLKKGEPTLLWGSDIRRFEFRLSDNGNKLKGSLKTSRGEAFITMRK